LAVAGALCVSLFASNDTGGAQAPSPALAGSRHLPIAIFHLPSSICHLPFAIFHFPSSICHLPFAIFHLPFAICHLPFANCQLLNP
jgi:hypothetical protein